MLAVLAGVLRTVAVPFFGGAVCSGALDAAHTDVFRMICATRFKGVGDECFWVLGLVVTQKVECWPESNDSGVGFSHHCGG